MSDRSIGSQESVKRQECFRRLFLHEWRRRRITNKEMARNMSISPRTVEIHRAKMMGKIGAASSAHAVRIRIDALAG